MKRFIRWMVLLATLALAAVLSGALPPADVPAMMVEIAS
jgi:predicted small lipoprotein YifL